MQPQKQLTVIISFLNEGYEVERTVSSVLEFAENKVDILVINDGSNSLYDYEEMLRPYSNVKYVKNEVRRGVTVCRHWGVQQIETPYFILLDAHMRFYEKGWVDKIVSYLQEDDRRILCCQTRALIKDESDEIIVHPTRKTSYGAYIHLQDENKLLSPKWIYQDRMFSDEAIEDVPCILGATYAASKRYWNYIKGLEGLKLYGHEEPYLSMKVWMEGGRCQLIKDIEVGHIYRTKFPYRVGNEEMMYNRMWIAAVLLPEEYRNRVYEMSQKQDENIFQSVLERLKEKKDIIDELKDYYRQISMNNFALIEQLNFNKL